MQKLFLPRAYRFFFKALDKGVEILCGIAAALWAAQSDLCKLQVKRAIGKPVSDIILVECGSAIIDR